MELTRIQLKKGDCLLARLEDWLTLQGQVFGFVVQVVGEVNPIKLKLPGQNRIFADYGPYTITQLQAHLTPNKVLVNASFAGFDGKTIGGQLAYGTTIATDTEIILGYKPLGLLPVDSFFSKFTENQ